MTENNDNVKEVVLRDIEPILRQKLGDHITVERFTTKSLLPPGENYGSTIMKVDVVMNNLETDETEQLYLIAKMCPPTEYQRQLFNSSRTFLKEIFMYETIIPAYNKLEMECGTKKNEVFDILPKFYGSRLSLSSQKEFDDNAVILMENLKVSGYYNGDRSMGYDLEHSTIAIKALARFHALGMAMKQKKPGIFEMFKMQARPLQSEGNPNILFKSILEVIKSDPEMSPYYEKCHDILYSVKISELWSDVNREPWTTIIHSDFWVNNIMFHRDLHGKIDGIKFVDFQIYLYGSPIRDLLFFLYSSVQTDITEEQIDDLMDLYYESIVNILKKMGCSVDAFTKEGFLKKVSEDAVSEFIHLCFMIKLLTLDTTEINDFDYGTMQKAIVEYSGSQMFITRLRRLVLCFTKRNWI